MRIIVTYILTEGGVWRTPPARSYNTDWLERYWWRASPFDASAIEADGKLLVFCRILSLFQLSSRRDLGCVLHLLKADDPVPGFPSVPSPLPLLHPSIRLVSSIHSLFSYTTNLNKPSQYLQNEVHCCRCYLHGRPGLGSEHQ